MVIYYEYVLLYVDDALVVSHRGKRILCNKLGKYFELKEESIGPPKQFLGGKVSRIMATELGLLAQVNMFKRPYAMLNNTLR